VDAFTSKDTYVAMLAGADQQRMGDLDGRGNLSLQRLREFCKYILETALDQVTFTAELLELDTIQERIRAYVELEVARNRLSPKSSYVLIDVLLKGSISRGEVTRLTAMSERSARDLIGDLLARELLCSDSPKGILYLGFPSAAVPYYFPRLYPETVELGMETDRRS
jgi:hypothetical protein